MIVGSLLIICLSNYVPLTSSSPLNNQVLVCGKRHQIEAQFNLTLLLDWEASSDYSAGSQSPLNYYFSLLYLHDAPSLLSPLPLCLPPSLPVSHTVPVCTTCFVFFHFLLAVQSVLSGRQHLDARWTLIRVNENTVLLGERMTGSALKSLPLTRKWAWEKKGAVASPLPPSPGEEMTRGGEDVEDKGWKKCKYMVTVIGREV